MQHGTQSVVIQPEFRKRDIRSYVIRGGRMTEGQQSAFARYWPVYGLSIDHGQISTQSIFGNSNPLVVEIGYGMGDSLLEMAIAGPELNFLGIEVHPPGVGRLINEAGKRQLPNIRTYCADAIDVLSDCLAQGCVDRVQLFFPDPWHKKKHHKRRIVQPAFIELVAKCLKADGVFHLCTDWQPYAQQMMEEMSASDKFRNCAGEGQYSSRPSYRPVTKFERRGERLGHGVWDLLFSKK
ncbi:MAG: tRNA (guanosine(46)-N7)-methyltransferase TrmB [Pseudomonadales bacterium]|nr:tRNA (guanosine(46)-N7)-methyltransferase TrmB [Pseudomonadales bacterium]